MTAILVLCALDFELAPFAAAIPPEGALGVPGLDGWRGALDGASVAMARIGVGKVNAAMATALALAAIGPRAVICCGVAGGVAAGVAPGDVIIADRLVQHDYGRWYTDGFALFAPLRYAATARHPPHFAADPALLAAAQDSSALLAAVPGWEDRPPQIRTGCIATGDLFVVSRAKKAEIAAQTGALALEMESAAVAQVCAELAVPLLAIRAISDVDDDLHQIPESAGAIAASNAAGVAIATIRAILAPPPSAAP